MAMPVDLTKVIAPAFTENVVLDVVRKKLNLQNVVISNVNISSASKKGEAYLSQVTRITIDAEEHNGSGENQVFQIPIIVKTVPESLARARTFRSVEFFENETAFYNVVWPAMDAFQKSKKVSNPYDCIPLCLATFSDGKRDFIVLEDVSPKGYVSLSRDDPVDLQLASYILKNFARFHAISVAYREQRPEEFQKIAENVKETYFCERNRKWYSKIMVKYQHVAKDAAKKELPPKYLEKLNEVLKDDLYGNICKLFEEDTKFRAVNHGDCWGPNLLIKGDEENREIVLIDFQLMRYTSVAMDILFFMYTCVDPDVCYKHWNLLLEQYFATFTDTLKDLGSKLDLTFEMFKEEIKKYGYCGFGVCIDALVMAVLDDDKVVDVEDIKGDEDIPIENVWIIEPIENEQNRKRVAYFIKHVIDNEFI